MEIKSDGVKAHGQSNRLKITSDQKAVLQSVKHCRGAELADGINAMSLGELLQRSLESTQQYSDNQNAYAVAVVGKISDSSDSLVNLVRHHLPPKSADEYLNLPHIKFRDVNVPNADVCRDLASRVSSKIVGNWDIIHNNEVVDHVDLFDSEKDHMDLIFGDTLHQLVRPGFKSLPTNEELSGLRSKGHLHDGDFVDLKMYFIRLTNPQSGFCQLWDVTLVFGNQRCESTGSLTNCSIQGKVRERESDLNHDKGMSEDKVIPEPQEEQEEEEERC